jgi:hypothetical protein
MAQLTFTSEAKGGYGSNWFQPNGAFQLDLVFPNSDEENPVRLYSANDDNGTEPLALAAEMRLKHTPHISVPVLKVVTGAGVYYKVTSALEPISASYLAAQ